MILPKSSNVFKFCNALINRRSEPTKKIYKQGVGTLHWEEFRGNALGIGVEERIKSTYLELQQCLTDGKYSKNRIFIIGFSRGAYSARRFAHLLNFSGIPINVNDWGEGWDNFIEQNKNTTDLIHYTVKERITSVADYKPVNLPDNPIYVDENFV